MIGFELIILCFPGTQREVFCLTPQFLATGKMSQRPTNQTYFDTTHFRVHYDTTGTAGVDTKYVRLVAGVAEYCWEIEVDSMGFDEPPPDDTLGGSDIYDIYIIDLDGGLGYCATDGPGPDPDQEDYITYIAVAYDLDSLEKESVLSHEFMHACQMSYSAIDGDWFLENSATWAMEMVYPDNNYYIGYLFGTSPFSRPNYEITHCPYPNPDYYQYGGVAWPLFVMFWTGDTPVIEAFWDSMGLHLGDYSLEDMDGVLRRDYGDSLESALADYAVWRWFTSIKWDDWHWSEANLWPAVRTVRTHSFYPADGDQGQLPIYGPGGADFIVFDSWGAAESLYLYFDGQDGYAWDARVIGYRSGHDISSDIYEIDVDANGYGTIAVPTLDYDSLILVPYCLNWPDKTPGLSFIYWVNTVSVREQAAVESGLSGSLSGDCFRFNLPGTGSARVSVYDVGGRLVFGREGIFEKGENRVKLGKRLQPGIYIWRLSFAEKSTAGRSAIF
ncbi:MAG: hypothetical protein ACP5QG_09045 [candidate division WOR-3 bacterium]